MLKELSLYNPSMWKKYISTSSNLSSSEKEYLKFNWYQCSSKIYDSERDLWLARMIPSSEFFDSKSGGSYALKIADDPYFVVIAEEPHLNENSSISSAKIESLKKHVGKRVQGTTEGTIIGIAYLRRGCSLMCKEIEYEMRICNDLNFDINPSYLKELDLCDLTIFAKENYHSFARWIPNFPTPKQIDDMVLKKGCKYTSKYIYHLFWKK